MTNFSTVTNNNNSNNVVNQKQDAQSSSSQPSISSIQSLQNSMQQQQSIPAILPNFLSNYHRQDHPYLDIDTLNSNQDSMSFPRYTIQPPQQLLSNPPMNNYIQPSSNASTGTTTTNSNQSNPTSTPPFISSNPLSTKTANPLIGISTHAPQPFNVSSSSYGNSLYNTSNTNYGGLSSSSNVLPLNISVNNSQSNTIISTGGNSKLYRNEVLSSTLKDLTKSSLEIESLINSNSDPNKIPKDVLIKGYEDLQQIQNLYLNWFKYLNITDVQSFNKIEKQAVKTLSSMNTSDNDQNDATNSSINDNSLSTIEPSSKRIKLSSPVMTTDQTNPSSSSTLMLSSSLYNSNNVNSNDNNNSNNPSDSTKLKDNKLLQSPKIPSPSILKLSPSKFPSSLSSSTSLDINPLPIINNANPTGLTSAYGYGYQYQQYHYQQYQYQPSLPILEENAAMNKYNDDQMKLASLPHNHNANPISVHTPSMECQHCSSKGTPEWRRGPNGERTLCNACGLFYSKLIKKYGEDDAKSIMADRKKMGKCMDRRLSIT